MLLPGHILMASTLTKLLALLQLVGLVCCISTGDATSADNPLEVKVNVEHTDDLDTDETGWLIQEKLRQLEYIKNKAFSPILALKSPQYTYGGAFPVYSTISGSYPAYYYSGKSPNYLLNWGSYGKNFPKYSSGSGYTGSQFQFDQFYNSFKKGSNSKPQNWYKKGYSGGTFQPYKFNYAPDCYYFKPSTGFDTSSAPLYTSGPSVQYSYSSPSLYQSYGAPLGYRSSVKDNTDKIVFPEQSSLKPSSTFESPSSASFLKSSQSFDTPQSSGPSSWQIPSYAGTFPTSGTFGPYQPQISNFPSPSQPSSPGSNQPSQGSSYPQGFYPTLPQQIGSPPSPSGPTQIPFVPSYPGSYPTLTQISTTSPSSTESPANYPYKPVTESFPSQFSSTPSPSNLGGQFPQSSGSSSSWQNVGNSFPIYPQASLGSNNVTPTVRDGEITSEEVIITPSTPYVKGNIDVNSVGLKFGIAQPPSLYSPGSSYALSYYPNVFFISNGKTSDASSPSSGDTQQVQVTDLTEGSGGISATLVQETQESTSGLSDVISTDPVVVSADESSTKQSSSSSSGVLYAPSQPSFTNFYSTSSLDQTSIPFVYTAQQPSLGGVLFSPSAVSNAYPISFRYEQGTSPVAVSQGVPTLPTVKTSSQQAVPSAAIGSSQVNVKKEAIPVTEKTKS